MVALAEAAARRGHERELHDGLDALGHDIHADAARAGHLADPLRDLDERLVAGRVPERVVDELEVVEARGAEAQSSPNRFSPSESSACCASLLSRVSSPVSSSTPIVISTRPDTAVIAT